MKVFVLIACVTVVLANSRYAMIRERAEMVERINSGPNHWKATTDYELTMETSEIFLRHGACTHKSSNKLNVKVYSAEEKADLPKSYDPRDKWGKQCPSIGHIRDQSACGSCWAFGCVEAMTDRICIASNGTKNPILSAGYLMSCDNLDGGCNGGDPMSAYGFYAQKGIVTGSDYKSKDGCWPYPFKQCEHHTNKTHYPPCPSQLYPTPDCVDSCQKSYKTPFEKDLHFGKEPYALSTVENIQADIYKFGPVTAGFTVYADFLSYQSGVYHQTSTEIRGFHAVKIFGWGVEDGVDYWIVANSWNEDWGDKGFFKIRRGTNECDIEGSISASLPKLD
jgi:cathepsin B